MAALLCHRQHLLPSNQTFPLETQPLGRIDAGGIARICLPLHSPKPQPAVRDTVQAITKQQGIGVGENKRSLERGE